MLALLYVLCVLCGDPLRARRGLRVPAIRRIVPHIDPPLDLTVIPFRYRVAANGTVTVAQSKCRRACHRG